MFDPAAMFATVAQAVSGAFGGPYVSGKVIDQTGQVLDAGGSITDPGAVIERTCMVQIDAATEAMRAADGFAEGDMRFLILVATLSGSLDTDAAVEVLAGPNVGSWLVSGLERDSMGTHWQGRGRRAPTE